jgi:hypothetical protein
MKANVPKTSTPEITKKVNVAITPKQSMAEEKDDD